MAKINKFEDLEIWQKARELCQYIELLIQTTTLKTNYALKDQIDRSSGSIMIILQKVLKEMEIENLYNS